MPGVKGYKQSAKHIKNRSTSLMGHIVSDKTREKIRQTRLKLKIVPWNRGKIGGQIAWNKGLTKADPRVAKYGSTISKVMAGRPRPGSTGDKHWNWQNGLSKQQYPIGWRSLPLKQSIIKRDGNKCRICGCSNGIGNKKLIVHHIDYNKHNLQVSNLITLCRHCHAKTNFNREYWRGYFDAL